MTPLEQRATILGYFGLLPFMFAAFTLWFSPSVFSYTYSGYVMAWSMYYAAIILSFMGGIRWGLALLNDRKISDYVTINQLTWSVVPAIVAWLAVIPDNTIPGIAPNYLVRHIILLAAFIALLSADIQGDTRWVRPALVRAAQDEADFFPWADHAPDHVQADAAWLVAYPPLALAAVRRW